jgi:hypothetical protein
MSGQAKNRTVGDAVDAVFERVWASYRTTGKLPEGWLEQIQAHAYRTGRPLTKDEIRAELVRQLERMHREQGYKPRVSNG